MSLTALNSQYVGLNGLSGYYGYSTAANGNTLYSEAYVENAKSNIASSYDISATSSAYTNKGNVSDSSFTQQCQAINYLLKEKRIDAAIEKYDELYKDMCESSYYSGYTENEIKTLLQEKYMAANNSTLVNDIQENEVSDFSSAFSSSTPLFGALCEINSTEDFLEKAAGIPVSESSGTDKFLGVAAGTALWSAIGVGVGAFFDYQKNSSVKTGKGKLIGGITAAALSIGTYIVSNCANSNKA